MRVSELVERSGITLPMVKLYIREGLLSPGSVTSRTRAEYDESHVERLTLIGVLRETVGLSLDQVRTVIAQIDDPSLDRVTAIGRAMAALPPAIPATVRDHPAVDSLVASLGWLHAPEHPIATQLEVAIDACRAAGLPLTPEVLADYATAMLDIARIDVSILPGDPASAIRTAIVGTAVGDVLIAALRRLAQLQIAAATT